jgi:thioredoxin 1
MALEFKDENFAEEVREGIAIADFWAEWCGPCKRISPIVEELAQEYQGKVKIGKVNVDDNTEISEQFGIMSIPTILFFKNGELVDKIVGAVNKNALKDKIDSLLQNC